MAPVFLMIEVEQPEGISARKLVIETAKYNVLTAYSGAEGLLLFERFPVDAAVVHSQVQDIPCWRIVEEIKARRPGVPVVVLSPGDYNCEADYVVSAYDPGELLATLRRVAPHAD